MPIPRFARADHKTSHHRDHRRGGALLDQSYDSLVDLAFAGGFQQHKLQRESRFQAAWIATILLRIAQDLLHADKGPPHV
jgi:hypothetical protein